jgi:HK97 family phage portal protein
LGAKIQIGGFNMSWGNSETRSSEYDGLATINGSILQSILQGDNFTGEPITVRKGLQISTVFTAVNVISNTLASLPLAAYKSENGKTEKLTDHDSYYALAHEPNDYMTAANFWKTLALHEKSWGNGYAKINRSSRQRPLSYDIMEPWEVTMSKSEGRLWYHYKGETYSSWDVLHFRNFSYDGICGRSPILQNERTMGMAIKLDRFASMTLGSRPPGVLSYEGNLNPAQMAENKKNWKDGGTDVKVLTGKWHYEPIMNQADQAQFMEAKQANKQEILGIYQIPPPFAQDYERATFSNAEQSDLVYAKHTVTPIVTNYEKEINMKVFYENEKSTHFVKFNMNGLLRGDLASRQSFYQSMVNSGIYLRNEARELEDLNGYEGGSVPLIQGAMIPGDEQGIEALRTKMEQEVIPSAKPVNGKEKHLNGHTVLN